MRITRGAMALALTATLLSGGSPLIADDGWNQPEVDAAKANLEAARAALEAAQVELARAKAAVAEAEAAAAEGTAAPEGAGAPDVAAPDDQEPAKLSFSEGWKGKIEFGLSGSDGNTDRLNLAGLFEANRATERHEDKIAMIYFYATESGTDTQNRFRGDYRHDWLFPDSKWRAFVRGTYEYDEFQDWDHRLSGFGGPSYEFIKNNTTSLIGSLGLGGSYETGGDDEDFFSEALVGLAYVQQIDERNSISVYTELVPTIDDISRLRWNTRASYDLLVSEESNLYLSLGIDNRYQTDSGPNTRRNDIDYFATLGWKL